MDTSNKAAAAVKARDIYLHLIAHRWEPTLAKLKPRIMPKANLTLKDFADLYREAIRKVEYPPSKPTAERYLKSLAFICQRVHVTHITALTPENVKAFGLGLPGKVLIMRTGMMANLTAAGPRTTEASI